MSINNDDYIGYKIKLYPTIEQEEVFKRYFGAARFVYNLGISLQENHYKQYKEGKEKRSTLTFIQMNNKLTELKNTDEFNWLSNYDAKSLTYVIKDVIKAFKKFFNKQSKYPKYKIKKNAHQMFPIRSDRMIITDNYVKISSIGNIYIGNHIYYECIGSGNTHVLKSRTRPYKNFYNSRIIFDGCDYWLCFSLPVSNTEGNEVASCNRFKNNEIWQHKKFNKPIGIDINCHRDSWITLSNGKKYERPNTSKEDKQIKKYDRKLKIKQKVNKEKKPNSTVANKLEEPNYTKNEEKILKKLNKAYKRRTNKKLNVIHECACDILREKPEYIVMETIYEKNMFMPKSNEVSYKHRKNHNRLVKESMIYSTLEIIRRTLYHNNIPVYKANQEFPSSQLCSCCGYKQKIGTKREYICPHCGNVIDRDINAAINLSNYFDYEYYLSKIV